MSFKSVQKKIQGEGYSKASAGAILASATRNASPAAKRKNPKLNRVLMPKHPTNQFHGGHGPNFVARASRPGGQP